MKVLIVINDLDSGGAQKSLSSFLKALEKTYGLSEYDIDLLLAEKRGIFLEDIPQNVNILNAPRYFKWMNCELKNLRLLGDFSALGIYGKVLSIVKKKLNVDSQYAKSAFWYTWRKVIPDNPQIYDVAIGYMDGWPDYYVSEKVRADYKILWVHNEYQKLGYYKELDEKCYKNSKKIVTISEECRDSLIQAFPELEDKIEILENITLTSDIEKKADSGYSEEFANNEEKIKILSVGRLAEQKAFDLAIKTAGKLKKRGIDFIWVILGEGPDREKLSELISSLGLENHVLMPGIKENPYPYIRNCDIFTQTSIYEGKSIVLDEAKLLCKPIVVTDYKTVYSSIQDHVNGIIVHMNEDDVADGIEELVNNKELRDNLISNLRNDNFGNEKEIIKYVDVMLKNIERLSNGQITVKHNSANL